MENEMNEPLVSVIVPCYNHEKYVEQTIKSIVNQTYKNIELIVIDDGSKDKSPEILKELSKKYNFYYEYQQNIGLPATLNKMIKMAKGKYISLIASDDVKTLDKIEVLVKEFEELSDDYAVVCGDAKFIDDNGKEICLEVNGQECSSFLDSRSCMRSDFDYKNNFGEYVTLLQANYIPAMSTLIKKEALYKVGLYEENISIEDWNMWLKLARTYKMKHIDRVVSFYRWHENNSIKTMLDKLMFDALKIFEREQDFCYLNGQGKLWEQRYYGGILDLFLLKKYSLFCRSISKNNVLNFSKFCSKKIIRRFYTKDNSK